ncbi:hypothetical protein [Vibrio metoecus]|uniref:hypothetical protein n=1 Tax=Vibrio metoecus TaxID=1481663 RepID=UPI00215CD9D6|nr:hypothetical protein [Vibrio metoecus]MCR9385489.1 hypothetical protein [Vibrio metoecus]
MKRFFPSTVMLVPFVVKHYPEHEEFSSANDSAATHPALSMVTDHLTDTPKAQDQSVEG